MSALTSLQYGSTNPRDWPTATTDSIHQLLVSLSRPVYHVVTVAEYDMERDHRGRRRPFIEAYTIHVWTTDDAGERVVNTYSQNVGGKPRFDYVTPMSEFDEVADADAIATAITAHQS